MLGNGRLEALCFDAKNDWLIFVVNYERKSGSIKATLSSSHYVTIKTKKEMLSSNIQPMKQEV